MKYLMRVFPAGHLVNSILFIVCAATLVFFALHDLWLLRPGVAAGHPPVNQVLNAIALLTVALAALQLAQTIIEVETPSGKGR